MKHHPDDAAHVATCDDCQARASLDGLDVDLERAWTGVAAKAWSSPVSWPERTAAWLLRSPALARALVNTPSLLLSWILATAVVLAAGVLATPLSGDPWVALLAPALAGVGIAYAYGPGVDPAFELNRTMATSDRMVLLVRTLAVFGLNAALGLVASLFSVTTIGITLGWLLPMTTVCALALAVATLARSANVGVGAALLVWGFIITALAARTQNIGSAVEIEALMPAYAVCTVALILLTLYATGGRGGLSWK
ncbi:hypothetical protein BH24ACT21_BH24ACT21_09270 [soil metagenome]|jgi:hypothetical protein